MRLIKQPFHIVHQRVAAHPSIQRRLSVSDFDDARLSLRMTSEQGESFDILLEPDQIAILGADLLARVRK